MQVKEPIYARRQLSDRFNTSPDQYDISGTFGNFGPKFSIKNRFPDKQIVVNNVEYVGRLESYILPKSPRYTISTRYPEKRLDTDGIVGPTYIPPAFGSDGRKPSIGQRYPDKQSQAMMSNGNNSGKDRIPPFSARSAAPRVSERFIDYSIPTVVHPTTARRERPVQRVTRDPNHIKPDFESVLMEYSVREPKWERGGQCQSARSANPRFGMSKPGPNEMACGPIGNAEFRMLPNLPSGRKFTIGNRETADLVR